MAKRREITGVKEYGALIHVKPVTNAVTPPLDSVRLATGEYVGQSEFRKLSGPEQSLLMRSGVAAFNREQEHLHKQKVKAYEAEKARYEATTIEVGPGKEPILRAEFHKLTPKQQSLLSRVGVEEFNKRQAAEATKAKLEAAKVRATLVELSTGELVPKVEFNKLTPKHQADLRKLGITAFNKKYALKPREAWYTVEVPVTVPPGLVLTGKDEYISEVDFKELTSAEQQRLKRLGVKAYNKQIEQEKKTWLVERGGVVGVISAAEAARREAAYRAAAQVVTIELPKTDAQIRQQVMDDEPGATNIKITRRDGAVDVSWEIPAPKVTVTEAYNQMLGVKIPFISKLVTTQAEFEKTGEIEYEIPVYPPTLDYKALEKKFLAESGRYQYDTVIATLDPGWYAIDPVSRLVLKKPAAYAIRSEADKRKVLEGYAQLTLTPAGKPAKFKAPPITLPIAKVGSIIGWGERVKGVDPFRSPEEFGKTVLEAAAIAIPAVWAKDAAEMEPWQIAVNVAIDVAFIGLVFGGPVIRALRPSLRATVKAAKVAGKAHVELKVAVTNLRRVERLIPKGKGTYVDRLKAAEFKGKKKLPISSKVYASYSREVQKAIQKSIKADRTFIDQLSFLKNIRPYELAKFEKFSGMKGLKKSVTGVSKQVIKLDKAWKAAEKYPMSSEGYIKALPGIERAKTNLDIALSNFYMKTKPRRQFGPHAGWDDAINTAEREVFDAQQAANRAAAATSKAPGIESLELWLRDAQFDLRNAKIKLENMRAAKAGGREFPPAYANPLWTELEKFLKKERKPLSPKAREAMEEVIAKERAAPKPWEVGPRVAVAVKERVRVAPEIKPKVVTPRVAEKVAPEVKPAVPKVKPSFFPGLTVPKIRVITRTKTETVSASELARMTPEQAARIYGSEILVEAIGIPITRVGPLGEELVIPREAVGLPTKAAMARFVTKGAEWVSPMEAIKRAQKIEAASYAKQIEQSAIKEATRAAQMNKTAEQISEAVEAAIKTQTRAITDTKVRAKVETLLRTEVVKRLETAIKIRLRIPIKLRIFPPIVLPEAKEVRKRKTYPNGTAVWKQGLFWKIIPPPYSVKRPISSREAPVGVTVLEGTPQETLCFIGGVIPTRDISFDLGITDGFIDVKAQRIVFTGYGEETLVGLRMPETTKGLTMRRVAPVRKYKKPRARSTPQVRSIRL